MYKLGEKTLRKGRAFTDDNGVQYPPNWLTCATHEDLTRVGITIEPDPEPAPIPEPPEHAKAQRRLDIADTKQPRAVDDIIDTLVDKGVIALTNLPQVVQDRHAQKKADRAIIAQEIADGLLRVP